jgi:hypothetical protein
MVNGGSCQPERASLRLLHPFGVTNSGKPTETAYSSCPSSGRPATQRPVQIQALQ